MTNQTRVRIRIKEGGPFVVEGDFDLIAPDGACLATNNPKGNVALCRCGQSNSRPYCDGAHRLLNREKPL